MIVVNGESKKISAKLNDGKSYVDYSFLGTLTKLSDNSFNLISSNDISSKNNLNNSFFSLIANAYIPLWIVIILILAVGVLFVVFEKVKKQK